MLQKISLAWLLLFTLMATSCVSKKKYQAAVIDAHNKQMSVDSLLRKNSELQSQLNDAISSNKMLTSERDKFQKESEDSHKALEGYTSAVNEYMTNMDEVEKKLKDAMADYADRGANVEYKNGWVYLTLDDKLLYKSGSSKPGFAEEITTTGHNKVLIWKEEVKILNPISNKEHGISNNEVK